MQACCQRQQAAKRGTPPSTRAGASLDSSGPWEQPNRSPDFQTPLKAVLQLCSRHLRMQLVYLPAGRSPKLGFEGGQTPLRQRVPKRGFRNASAINYVPLNLTKLMKCVQDKRLDASQVMHCELAASSSS